MLTAGAGARKSRYLFVESVINARKIMAIKAGHVTDLSSRMTNIIIFNEFEL
jgi:hypothetical protein